MLDSCTFPNLPKEAILPLQICHLPLSATNKKILLVGVGGIGCEVLKNALVCGFTRITLVDLDTIELSNLNRQFFFRETHIGKSKAQVAASQARLLILDNAELFGLDPFSVENVHLEAHKANIMDLNCFPLAWWRSFDLILSALDNIEARTHVNLMALTVQVPVIESGTAGFLGQASIIIPRNPVSECYDCKPRQSITDKNRVFPVCTIRSTPTEPIHCIVWAKDYLYARLFNDNGSKDQEENHAIEDMDEASSSKSESTLTRTTFINFEELKSRFKEDASQFARALFEKVFIEDVHAIAQLEELWKENGSQPPAPLSISDYNSMSTCEDVDDDAVVWPLSNWITLFSSSAQHLHIRAIQSFTRLPFDKDDEDIMSFVAASSNLRAHCYSILPLISKFDIKGIAGNIIPSIATTNAIAAGLVISKAIKILQFDDTREKISNLTLSCTYITDLVNVKSNFLFDNPSRWLINEQLQGPNPACTTCNVHRVTLAGDCQSLTLGKATERVLTYLNATSSLIFSIVQGARLLYDSLDFTDNWTKTLYSLNVFDSYHLTITFELQDDNKNDLLVLPVVFAIDISLKSDIIDLCSKEATLAHLMHKKQLKKDEEIQEPNGSDEDKIELGDELDDSLVEIDAKSVTNKSTLLKKRFRIEETSFEVEDKVRDKENSSYAFSKKMAY